MFRRNHAGSQNTQEIKQTNTNFEDNKVYCFNLEACSEEATDI